MTTPLQPRARRLLTEAAADAEFLAKTARGAADGVAGLGSDGKVPAEQLPAGSGAVLAIATSGTSIQVPGLVPGRVYLLHALVVFPALGASTVATVSARTVRGTTPPSGTAGVAITPTVGTGRPGSGQADVWVTLLGSFAVTTAGTHTIGLVASSATPNLSHVVVVDGGPTGTGKTPFGTAT